MDGTRNDVLTSGQKIHNSNINSVPQHHAEHDVLRRMLELDGEMPPAHHRSGYAGTLERLRACVPHDRIKVLLCKDIFEGDAASELTEFLGFNRLPAPIEDVVNGGIDVPMDEARCAGPTPDRKTELS